MENIKLHLLALISKLDYEKQKEIKKYIENNDFTYPFNECSFLLANLLYYNKINMNDYYNLENSHKLNNLNLPIFEISPRIFGEGWAQNHLKQFIQNLNNPSKIIDPKYDGEYDLYLDNKIKIEVKASRAVDSNSKAPLNMKALSSKSNKKFRMNFQQIKPKSCDVFVLIAVWTDIIRYWTMSSYDLEHHKHYSKSQHRGNVGEGQIHILSRNINDFNNFEVTSDNLNSAIRKVYNKKYNKYSDINF